MRPLKTEEDERHKQPSATEAWTLVGMCASDRSFEAKVKRRNVPASAVLLLKLDCIASSWPASCLPAGDDRLIWMYFFILANLLAWHNFHAYRSPSVVIDVSCWPPGHLVFLVVESGYWRVQQVLVLYTCTSLCNGKWEEQKNNMQISVYILLRKTWRSIRRCKKVKNKNSSSIIWRWWSQASKKTSQSLKNLFQVISSFWVRNSNHRNHCSWWPLCKQFVSSFVLLLSSSLQLSFLFDLSTR